jgi:hypothetical protein
MRKAAHEAPHSIVLAAILLLVVSPACAKPPELHPAPETPRDGAQLEAGQSYVFRVMYQDPDNDRPTDAALVAQGPSGTNRITPDLPRTGDFRAGVPLEWKGNVLAPGTWRFHFEAASVDGKARLPEGSGEITVTVVSMVTQWILLAVGLGVALLALPMFVFFIARGMSKRVDAGATARFALIVGVLAAAAWYCYLFTSIFGTVSAIVVGVLALGGAFVLATMRR